jgi:DNA-binding transcriptional LysR family regulator
MCVEEEIASGRLCEVRVKEIHVERKVRLVYPKRRALSHAAQAFLKVVGRLTPLPAAYGAPPARQSALAVCRNPALR